MTGGRNLSKFPLLVISLFLLLNPLAALSQGLVINFNDPRLQFQNQLNCMLAGQLFLTDAPDYAAAVEAIAKGADVNGICLTSLAVTINSNNEVTAAPENFWEILPAAIKIVTGNPDRTKASVGLDIVKFLIAHKVNVNRFSKGRTPLSIAIESVRGISDGEKSKGAPYYYSAPTESIEKLVDVLLGAGANPFITSYIERDNTGSVLLEELKRTGISSIGVDLIGQIEAFPLSCPVSARIKNRVRLLNTGFRS
jgi:hypothetical protein